MFEMEPCNLVLNRLFCSGVLHEYLEHYKTQVDPRDKTTHLNFKLLRIYAGVMFRRRLPPNITTKDREMLGRRKHMPTLSCPVLEPLGSTGSAEDKKVENKVQAVIDAYNRHCLETFNDYARACTQGQA